MSAVEEIPIDFIYSSDRDKSFPVIPALAANFQPEKNIKVKLSL